MTESDTEEECINDDDDPMYDPTEVTEEDNSDDNVDSEIFSNKQQHCSNTSINEPKFLVFWTSLLTLFRFCFTCFQPNCITSTSTRWYPFDSYNEMC